MLVLVLIGFRQEAMGAWNVLCWRWGKSRKLSKAPSLFGASWDCQGRMPARADLNCVFGHWSGMVSRSPLNFRSSNYLALLAFMTTLRVVFSWGKMSYPLLFPVAFLFMKLSLVHIREVQPWSGKACCRELCSGKLDHLESRRGESPEWLFVVDIVSLLWYPVKYCL